MLIQIGENTMRWQDFQKPRHWFLGYRLLPPPTTGTIGNIRLHKFTNTNTQIQIHTYILSVAHLIHLLVAVIPGSAVVCLSEKFNNLLHSRVKMFPPSSCFLWFRYFYLVLVFPSGPVAPSMKLPHVKISVAWCQLQRNVAFLVKA